MYLLKGLFIAESQVLLLSIRLTEPGNHKLSMWIEFVVSINICNQRLQTLRCTRKHCTPWQPVKKPLTNELGFYSWLPWIWMA